MSLTVAQRLNAKDAEIAELRAKLDETRNIRDEHYDLQGEHQETSALLGAWQQRAQQAEAERDEALECVRMLWRALDDLRGAELEKCMRYDGHEDQMAAVTAAFEALDSTPEHLR